MIQNLRPWHPPWPWPKSSQVPNFSWHWAVGWAPCWALMTAWPSLGRAWDEAKKNGSCGVETPTKKHGITWPFAVHRFLWPDFLRNLESCYIMIHLKQLCHNLHDECLSHLTKARSSGHAGWSINPDILRHPQTFETGSLDEFIHQLSHYHIVQATCEMKCVTDFNKS